jgi:predicted exporter
MAVRWLCLAVLAVAGAWVIATRLTLSYDLIYFLPQPVTDAQRVLIDRVGQGPGSRILFVTLPGATADQRDRAAAQLDGLEGVRSVLPRDLSPGLGAIPAPLFAHRYLLTDVDMSVVGLQRALQARLRDLSMIDDPEFLELVAADPHLASVQVLEGLAVRPPDDDSYLLDGDTPYLLLETRPPSFDLAAQQALVADVVEALATLQLDADLYGAGAYGVHLQQAVRQESTFFSVAAAAALAVLLWVGYRSWRAVLLVSIPLAAGGLVGLAALALIFPQVHGITLAFGFTLMGVTVDYGLHVLSHVRGGGWRGSSTLWPTLLLSVASTALAFLAFTLSGSRGLVQLGVFSTVGILAAGLCAWLLLPHLAGGLPAGVSRAGDAEPLRIRLRFWPLLLCLALGAALLATQETLWNDDLSALTPVPPETLAVDRRLRQQTQAPDIRYLVVSRGPDASAVLERVGALADGLDDARARGIVDGYQAVTSLVPEPALQQRRRAALQADGVASRLQQAVAGLPFRVSALQPFLEDVRRTASADALINADSYSGTVLGELVEGMLYQDAGGWVALTFLVGLNDPAALATQLTRSLPDTELVDLQAASRSLLGTYRGRLLEILAGALVAVVLVLAFGLRSVPHLTWVVGTLLASVMLTTAVVSRLLGSLSLFDLMATTLVAGLGLDYALFFSRGYSPGGVNNESRGRQRDTLHALTICFTSTAAVFGLLSTSGIPVLHGIGVTVTVGVVVAYLLAFCGRYVRPTT